MVYVDFTTSINDQLGVIQYPYVIYSAVRHNIGILCSLLVFVCIVQWPLFIIGTYIS